MTTAVVQNVDVTTLLDIEALRSIGCVISGEHPIMDDAKHRITVEGEKFSKNAGS